MAGENYIDLVASIMERRTRNDRPLAFVHTYDMVGQLIFECLK